MTQRTQETFIFPQSDHPTLTERYGPSMASAVAAGIRQSMDLVIGMGKFQATYDTLADAKSAQRDDGGPVKYYKVIVEEVSGYDA